MMLRLRSRNRIGGLGSGSGVAKLDGSSYIALLGDSLEQHNLTASSSAGSEEFSHWSRGYYNWARILDPRGYHINWFDSSVTARLGEGLNRGVSGNNTSQMNSRKTEITDIPNVKVCILGGFTNDISTDTTSGNRAARLALGQSNYNDILAHFKSNGIKTIIVTPPPRTLAQWASGSAGRGLWMDWCAWCQTVADADPDWVQIVRRDIICSNADADLTPKTGYLQADDVHLTPIAGFHIADDSGGVCEKVANIVDPFTDFPAAVTSGDLCTNPTLSGSSGSVSSGVTGVAPTGMRCRRTVGSNITAVGSKETINGEEYYKLVITRDGAGLSIETIALDLGGNISTGLPDTGDWLQHGMKFKADASDSLMQIALQAREQPSTPANMNVYAMKIDGSLKWENAAIQAADGGGVWQMSPAWQWRADGTSIIYNALISVDNTVAGTDTVWISRMHLIPILDPRPDLGFSTDLFLTMEDGVNTLQLENSNYLELE